MAERQLQDFISTPINPFPTKLYPSNLCVPSRSGANRRRSLSRLPPRLYLLLHLHHRPPHRSASHPHLKRRKPDGKLQECVTEPSPIHQRLLHLQKLLRDANRRGSRWPTCSTSKSTAPSRQKRPRQSSVPPLSLPSRAVRDRQTRPAVMKSNHLPSFRSSVRRAPIQPWTQCSATPPRPASPRTTTGVSRV